MGVQSSGIQISFIILLLTVFESSNAATCSDFPPPCDIGEYCIPSSPTDVVCVGCSQACNGCRGSGPDNCIACAIGYKQDFGICVECEVGTFGVECAGTCHCLNQELCRKDTGYCEGWRCERGYMGSPFCNKTCEPLKYGVDCAENCHCPINDTCSPINGLCASGQCASEYGGPSCSIRLPKLVSPPLATLVTCGTIRVSWNAWQEDVDIGENSVGQYSVYYMVNDTVWQLYREIFAGTGRAIFAVDVNIGLVPDEYYRFRIDTHRTSDGKVKPATPGFATDPIFNACTLTPSTTLPTTTTTRSYIGARVFDNIILNLLTDNSIRVTWDISVNVTNLDFNITVKYKIIGIGDCAEVNGSETVLQASDKFAPIELNNLEFFRRYQVIVEASGSQPVISDKMTRTIVTGETVPSGVVSNYRTRDLKATSLELLWEDVPCAQRGGILLRYDVMTTNMNTSAVKPEVSNVTSVILSGLTPFTSYSVSVRYVNFKGEGSYSPLFYFQTAEAPPSGVSIINLVPTSSTITVSFEPPDQPNGIISEYSITYSDNSLFEFPTSLTHSASLGLTAIIRNVRAYTMYYIKVRARTNAGSGSYGTSMSIRTLQDSPSAPVAMRLVSRNITCIWVSWQPPLNPNGIIGNYTVVLREVISNTDIIIASMTTGATSAQKCNLLPGTLYRFLVTANNGGGASPALVEDYWTDQDTPPAPPVPIFVASSFTTITISIDPVVITPGPKISYQIQVQKAPARRKRHPSVPGYVTGELTLQEVPSRREFVIGDGSTVGGFVNQPLETDETYQIYYAVLSTLNNSTKVAYSVMPDGIIAAPFVTVPATTSAPPATASTNIGLIIALAVILFLLLLALIIGLCIWWHRRRRPAAYKPSTIDMTTYPPEYDPEEYWSKVFSFRDTRYIIAGRDMLPSDPNDINGYTICGPDSDKISFNKEFQSLPRQSKSGNTNIASMRKNSHKNRFPHLLPYDEKRVKLPVDQPSDSDYINASYIRDNQQKVAYIAAQSPFNESTVIDFWKMIFNEGIKTVVMLTKGVEDNIVKCTLYWPEIDNTQITCGRFFLELTEVDEYADYTIRMVEIQDPPNRSKSVVCIFEYTSWPDHGVPRDPIPFLEMRHKCRNYHDDDSRPILVHCGTGMSRTGVFIAVDSLIEEYEKNGRVSVYNFVKKIRMDRPYMVRTFAQYVFIYDCLFDEFYAGDTLVGQGLKTRYHDLCKKNVKTGHSYLKDQFRLLEKFTFGPPASKCSDALLMSNQTKNRYYDVVPHNNDRPILTTPGGVGRNDYINAIFLDGYRKQQQFIVTQTPLHTTIIDFWKLVYDYDINTIVMMENYDNKDDTCAKYWPDVKMKQFEPFLIEASTVTQMDNITSRNFKIHNLQRPNDNPKVVCQFQYNDWSEPNFVPVSKTMMLDLIDIVNDWQELTNNNSSPILVHCKDGATHSGIFTTLSVICEKMDNDNEVDLFHTIRHMKKKRKQIVSQMEQYRFLYKALWDFINLRMEGGTLTEKMEKTNEAFEIESSPSLHSFYGNGYI